jgi:hypothetical protein
MRATLPGSRPAAAAALALLIPFLAVTSTRAAAQQALTEGTLALDEDGISPPATIEQVAWIAGHWRGEGLGGLNEEVWAPPLAGTMTGMYKLVRDGVVAFYEILTIAEEHGSLVLRLKHFNPDLTGWEEKDEVVSFRLVRLEDGVAWFDGLTFRRLGPDELRVHLAVGRGTGPPREVVFDYRRFDG